MRNEVGALIGTAGTGDSSAEIWAAWVGEHQARIDHYGSTMLSRDEQDRLARYRSRESAERYVVTRSLVRAVLAGRLGVEPRDIRIGHNARGKPMLSDQLFFNVSHSADLILMAVTGDRAVGVDVERRRDVERVQALTERWLTPEEQEDVNRITQSGLTLSEAFLRVWSLKEARLKALGVGIAGAQEARLDQVDAVPLDEVLEPYSAAGRGFVGAVAFA
ncbi:MAG TPA: 4'-phosphopantetheinyl transferase superfamily protein [Gemmatimonadaceae bacterium]|nr:4'-phosphopantetheinyl transferase superfamily protein [Gemmatimonadaceae bacterium]